jgi:hypothetical protein
MNFEVKNTNVAQKIGSLRNLVLVLFLMASCAPKSKLTDVNGDVQVKIPVSSQSGDSSEYQMSVVTLKSLSNLKEVAGFFAKFFFAPGLNQNQLVGDSPQARFVRTKDNVYLPVDSLSQQMATLYYHIQNLAEFSEKIGATGINSGPLKIGIETRVSDSDVLTKNNAFYDGQSDAMLFVPYSSTELPIAVNSGIIAHEYFHSLFYKIILKNFTEAAKPDTKNKIQKTYNETYLRGINEGIADFWGWLYTNDDDFIRWSLSAYSKNRKLVLSEQAIGKFQTAEIILAKSEEAVLSSAQPSNYLSDYIYQVGTPHARFLKQFTVMLSENGLDKSESKLQMAKVILDFLKMTAQQSLMLKSDETLPADLLFDFVASAKSKIKMTESQCQFALAYVSKNELRSKDSCQKQTDGSFLIQPPEVVVNP